MVTEAESATAGGRGLPFFGVRADRREAAIGGAVALAVVVGYVVVARAFDTGTTWTEAVSLWASLACVWLARTENIWAMPYGIVSVLLLGWFLLSIDLVAQGWMQFVYYVPIQLIGWWTWARGGANRTELRVSSLAARGWVLVIAGTLALWLACFALFDAVYDEPAYLAWDTSIVAASVTAQTLMTWKKRESWWFWTIPVNVSAIGLFARTEAWAFVFLYVVFLANSVWGWIRWQRAAARS